MQAAWQAFLDDLEEEAQAYTRELVQTYRQIGQKGSVTESVRRLVEANPYHDRRGRFSRGGHGGRHPRGPVTDAVSAAVGGGGGDGSATPKAVTKLLDTAGVQKSKKVSTHSAVGTKTNLVFHKTDGPGYTTRPHPSGQGTLVEFHGSSGTITRHRKQTQDALDKAGATHKNADFGNGIHVTSMFGGDLQSKAVSAATGTRRISATVGSVNAALGGHAEHFKAVSLQHGGVKLVHTGDLSGAELKRAENNAITFLGSHGAQFRHLPNGEVHITHFINPSEEAAGAHIARVKGPQKRGPTSVEQKMTANEAAMDVRRRMLAWDDQRTVEITKAKEQMEFLQRVHRQAAERWWGATGDISDPKNLQLQAHMNMAAKDVKAAAEHHQRLVDQRDQELKEKFIYQKPADIAMSIAKPAAGARKASPEELDRWKQGFEEFRKITGVSMNHSIAVHEGMVNHPNLTAADLKKLGIPKKKTIYFTTTNDDRSFNRMGQVNMGPGSHNSSVATTVHELGHTLEYETPAIARSRREFYDERTRGEQERKLRDVTKNRGYEDHEMTRADDFTHAYMGKDYGAHLKGTSEDRHSEMVSMGLQMLHENPIKLARQDPEYFDWIYSVTRGRAAEWHPAPRIIVGDEVHILGGTHAGTSGTVVTRGSDTEPYAVKLRDGQLWTVQHAHLKRM